MRRRALTRRTLLRAGAAGAAATGTAALAGCFGGTDPVADSARDPLAVVPDGTTVVLAADVDALLADQVLRTRLNDYLEDASSDGPPAPESLGAALDSLQETLGLDVRLVSTAVTFAGYEPDAPAGGVVWTDWTTDEVRDAASSAGASVRTEEYAGRTVLATDGGGAIGVLDEGVFVAGEPPTIEAVLDVRAGNEPAVEGRLRDGFTATADGAMRFAFVAPDDLGQRATGTGGGIDPATASALTHGYGAYVADGEARRATITLETDSADAATALGDTLGTALSDARRQARSMSGSGRFADDARAVLDSVEIATEGSSVTVSVGEAELLPIAVLVLFGAFAMPVGASSRSGPVAPQATFEFEYDADADVLAVTHYGGDVVRADSLYIRGDSFAADTGADMAGPGAWAGSTSAEVDGHPAVAAGDSVAIGAASDYRCRVVWESPDGSVSSELAIDRGPDA